MLSSTLIEAELGHSMQLRDNLLEIAGELLARIANMFSNDATQQCLLAMIAKLELSTHFDDKPNLRRHYRALAPLHALR